jgi:large subunit ribosomal protein L1
MKKRSKRYKKLKESSKKDSPKNFSEALTLVKKNSNTKFEESIDASVRLNVAKSKQEINLRSVVSLPFGTKKKIKVAVICEESKIEDSKKSGADIVGSDDLIEKISNGYLSFDKLVSTPSMMAKIGKLGKVLGPKGLMPNPKLGTVTTDIKKTVNEIKSGQVEIKNDKDGNVGFSFGKTKQSNEQLEKNFNAVFEVILKEKPNNIKGNFILSSYVTSTMGPSYKFKAKGAN